MDDNDSDNWKDAYDKTPTKPGYYAVLYMWDINEGIFDNAYYWDGKEWNCDLPICNYWGPFESEEEAEEYAAKNSPDR